VGLTQQYNLLLRICDCFTPKKAGVTTAIHNTCPLAKGDLKKTVAGTQNLYDEYRGDTGQWNLVNVREISVTYLEPTYIYIYIYIFVMYSVTSSGNSCTPL
jgi:hypothetical protein